MIKLENITKSYPMGKRELTVLAGVSLDVKQTGRHGLFRARWVDKGNDTDD